MPGKAPKFNFVPEHQLGEVSQGSGFWTVSLLASKATTTIYFPRDMVSALEMDGKYMQIFADTEKKVIGWRLVEDKTTLSELDNARKLTMNPTVGNITLGIGKIMKKLNYQLEKTISGLQVKTYMPPLASGKISYIELPDIIHNPKTEVKS